MLLSPLVALLGALPALSAALPAPALAPAPASSEPITLKDANFCIDNTDGRLADGNPLQLWECVPGNTNQQWVWEPLGVHDCVELFRVRLAGTDMCLAFKRPAKGSASGAPVVLAACDADLARYYTKWRWDRDWICSGLGRCLGVWYPGPDNGAYLGMTTTGNAEWEH